VRQGRPHPRLKLALGISINSATQYVKSKDVTSKRWAAPGVKPDQREDQFLRMRQTIEIQSYLEAESSFNMAIASCTVVINCAGKMMVEFFSVAISAIVCSVRS
jgi:hypothetical protein